MTAHSILVDVYARMLAVVILRTQDTSDPRHFGTIAELSGHFGTSAEMSWDTSALEDTSALRYTGWQGGFVIP